MLGREGFSFIYGAYVFMSRVKRRLRRAFGSQGTAIVNRAATAVPT